MENKKEVEVVADEGSKDVDVTSICSLIAEGLQKKYGNKLPNKKKAVLLQLSGKAKKAPKALIELTAGNDSEEVAVLSQTYMGSIKSGTQLAAEAYLEARNIKVYHSLEEFIDNF